jgi:hypothetical protein
MNLFLAKFKTPKIIPENVSIKFNGAGKDAKDKRKAER